MAEHMQVSNRTIWRWCKANKLTFIKVGTVTRICAEIPQSTLNQPEPDKGSDNGNSIP